MESCALRWRLGHNPLGEDVFPFTLANIVHMEQPDIICHGLASSGYVQINLLLEPSKTYFSTVRGVTNGGTVLEISSDGVTVDQTSPTIHIDSTVFVTWLGKPNIISVWAENSVSLVTKARTGTMVIDKTAPIASPAFIQLYFVHAGPQ
ncbi:uncharacterized protein LOC144621492 isoform X2 [Crassostrea virginica]